jgi:hypothetical protein
MQRNHEQECSRRDRFGGPWDACDHAADGRCGPIGRVPPTPTMSNEPRLKRRPIRDYLRSLFARQMAGEAAGGTPDSRGGQIELGQGFYSGGFDFFGGA